MGKDRNEQRKNTLSTLTGKKASKATADWSGVNGSILLNAIATISARGGALRFGYTRDGGAYALGIYLDGEHETVYLRPDEDIDHYLADFAENLRGLPF